MGKGAPQQYIQPNYQMPTYTAPQYDGPSDAERQARIDALKQQWDKEANLNKQIEVADVKREQLEETKEELDTRRGVEDILSSGQRGFVRKKQTTTEPDNVFLGELDV